MMIPIIPAMDAIPKIPKKPPLEKLKSKWLKSLRWLKKEPNANGIIERPMIKVYKAIGD